MTADDRETIGGPPEDDSDAAAEPEDSFEVDSTLLRDDHGTDVPQSGDGGEWPAEKAAP